MFFNSFNSSTTPSPLSSTSTCLTGGGDSGIHCMMQFLQLSLLHTLFAYSFSASVLLFLLHLSLTRPHALAHDGQLDSRIPPDHNHPIMPGGDGPRGEWLNQVESRPAVLVPRAEAGESALVNNVPQNLNIAGGETQNWLVTREVIFGPHGVTGPGLPGDNQTEASVEHSERELTKRQANRTLYITLNTCLQPSSKSARRDTAQSIPPQLQLFISQSPLNQEPRPSSGGLEQQEIGVVAGYALATVEAGNNVYIGVSAPNAPLFSGLWNYEIAASIDAPFHVADETSPNLYFVDSDDHAALLITGDTTQALSNESVFQEWMTLRPPFGMFAANQNDHSILGVARSYCGLKNNADVVANLEGVDNQNVADMTDRGLGGKPKEQFYLSSLNRTSTYWGFLAMEGNSTASGNDVVGGGGKVWAIMNFTTKTDSNCALLYNLSFCSEVAYAVPSNPNKFPPTTGLPELAELYDSNAAGLFQYFNYSLQQIPCNTTATAQYSLARNCNDCMRAYKQWLCAVTIPRCEDYRNPGPWLKPRNTAQNFINGSSILSLDPHNPSTQVLLSAVATNQSRNPLIDTAIQPGPYKEVLPCQDLCWDLVQSCPAALDFGCPYAGRGLEDSYGFRHYPGAGGNITCSWLGAAYYLNAAPGMYSNSLATSGYLAMSTLCFWALFYVVFS